MDINQLMNELEKRYPDFKLSIALGDRILLFDSNGHPAVEVKIHQHGFEYHVELFEYAKKLAAKGTKGI